MNTNTSDKEWISPASGQEDLELVYSGKARLGIGFEGLDQEMDYGEDRDQE